jgi:putative Mg2+ transporter-C (MgtC) family protein
MGSALVMIVSIQFAHHPWPKIDARMLNVDPARIAYGIMTGIGFLGAGTIVHSKGTVRGLTTAAGLWCVAAIGLCIGFGLYLMAFLSTLLVVGVLWILDHFEDYLPRIHYRTVTIRRPWRTGCVGETIERFKKAELNVADVNFDRKDDVNFVDINVLVAFGNKAQYYQFERSLEEDHECQVISAREL